MRVAGGCEQGRAHIEGAPAAIMACVFVGARGGSALEALLKDGGQPLGKLARVADGLVVFR